MESNNESALDFQRLELERERFKFERQGIIVRYLTILGAVAAFLWGAFTYFDGTRRERLKQLDELAQATAVQKIEASKPFLDRQLKLFEQATQCAAFIATSLDDSKERADRVERFWQLYWGELALVEHGEVERAMKRFGDALRKEQPDTNELQRLSLGIAHACRDELAKSWNISHWSRDE
jgi:hypothetical protein